jgi:CheY-like chemotaxis protein/anti-sigma regulatory factor (Ser/Thr protein kinase)
MVGTMAGGIAHDFNNILTPILGHAQLALEETGPDSTIREALEAILRAAGRARDVVRRILTFSRAGEQQERAPLYLQDVVREALELVRASLPATIELVSELDPRCPPVTGEPTQIHQVVLNLCTNAAHAIEPDTGRITVAVTMAVDPRAESSPDRERVRLTVRDTGAGISPNVLERMFDPFFTTKSAGEGTGLGLSVVHGIVANHDASITVESEPGGGSVFSVFFIPAELSTPGPVPAEPPCVAGSERLLFVDDEKPIRDLMVKGLGRLGYRVTACEDAREALHAFQAAPDDFDIVVTDMSMPGMTGAELLVALRRVRPGVPVLLVTGFANGAGQRAGGEEDFDATLLKPVGPKQLAERVRAVLATRWVSDA